MKVSFFETVRYLPPEALPSDWPAPSGDYDREAGARAYERMTERLQYVEDLGFDWVSVSEHHYSPRILTPSPVVSATYLAARVDKIKIALLGPIVPVSNPIRVAEELAMLARRDKQAPFPVHAGLREALLEADVTRNIAREGRPANVGGVLPISFCGGPERVVEQLRRCREETGAGGVDFLFQ